MRANGIAGPQAAWAFHVLMFAASAAPLTELHAELLRDHPGTVVSVCRNEGEPDWVERAVRTPTGQRRWQGEAPPVTEALDPFWGYGSIFYDSILEDPRWNAEPAEPPALRPVPGALEALPPPAVVPEYGCIHTALPDAPRWVRVVTTEERVEVLGRPPAFPADHGLGPP